MKPAYYIIGALALWIIFRECTRAPKPLPPSIQAHQDSILIKKDRVASLDKAGQAIARKMAIDSIRNSEALNLKEIKIQGLTKSLAAALNRKPSMRVDTIYILADSVIQAQASEITLLKVNTDSLRTNYASLLRIKDTELRIKDEIAGHMTAINQDLYKALNKERRRNKAAKILIPVALVLGFVIGNQ